MDWKGEFIDFACDIAITFLFFVATRHNRELNDLFSNAHPSILQFVAAIEELSREKVRVLEEIRKKKCKAPKRKIKKRKIPASHKKFVPKL